MAEAAGPHHTHLETRLHIPLMRATVQAIAVTTPEHREADARLA